MASLKDFRKDYDDKNCNIKINFFLPKNTELRWFKPPHRDGLRKLMLQTRKGSMVKVFGLRSRKLLIKETNGTSEALHCNVDSWKLGKLE